MVLSEIQILGFCLGILSWIGMIGTCASPEWRKSSQGQTLIDNQLRYEGLWVRCTAFATGQTQCENYNAFFVGLPNAAILDVLQVCRALVIASIAVGFIAIFVTVFGLKCVTIGPEKENIKCRVAMVGGLLFGVAGILTGAGVSRYAYDVIQDYYNPVFAQQLPAQLRFEYGHALFVGWGSFVCSLSSTTILYSATKLRHGNREAASVKLQKPSKSMHCYQPVSILQNVSKRPSVSLPTNKNRIKTVSRFNNVSFHPSKKHEDEENTHSKTASPGGSNHEPHSSVYRYFFASQYQPNITQTFKNSTQSTQSNSPNQNEIESKTGETNDERFYNKPIHGMYRTTSGSMRYYL